VETEESIDAYEKWFLDHRFAYVSELKAVQALLPKSGEGVEIGVGTGRFAAPLRIRHGVEPVAAMAALARRRGVEVAEGTAEKLPFGDERFDYALMVATFRIADDPAAALREARRVMKPGGVLVVGLIDRESPLGKGCQEQSVFRLEAPFFSSPEVVALMEKAGFHDFVFTQTIFQPLERIQEVEPVRQGHGEGSFVAVRGRK
jgi:ubiquinone/menaquinone biosynthesis C-methylase UbiE